eukprot:11165951-Lingulodinium_polyedra.AAC.1
MEGGFSVPHRGRHRSHGHPVAEAQRSDPGGHGGGARWHATIAGGPASARRPRRQVVPLPAR